MAQDWLFGRASESVGGRLGAGNGDGSVWSIARSWALLRECEAWGVLAEWQKYLQGLNGGVVWFLSEGSSNRAIPELLHPFDFFFFVSALQ